MPTITLSVPEDLKKRMDSHEMINWSAIAREAIKKQLDSMQDFALFEKIASKSQMTEKDTIELGRLINKQANKRLMNEINNRRKHNLRSNNKK